MPAPSPSCILKLAMPALLVLACAKGPLSGGPGTYRGLAANVNEIGVLDVTVTEVEKGPLPALGTLKFPSKTITLTGTLDKSKTQLVLSSSDGYTLVAQSRPAYAYGSYKNADDTEQGAFGLLLQDARSVELYCGSFTDATADALTSYPFAITGTPGGSAVCVGPNFAWPGGFGTDDNVVCALGGGTFNGNVNSTGNPWGVGTTTGYGTWAVSPCAGNGSGGDGGVNDGSAEVGPDGEGDAGAPAPDAELDAPAPIADAEVDAAAPAPDAAAQD